MEQTRQRESLDYPDFDLNIICNIQSTCFVIMDNTIHRDCFIRDLLLCVSKSNDFIHIFVNNSRVHDNIVSYFNPLYNDA
jgi:hypothetical protein